jgi:hypothetical protein
MSRMNEKGMREIKQKNKERMEARKKNGKER